jgi:osmotically-inducible protein OsmY
MPDLSFATPKLSGTRLPTKAVRGNRLTMLQRRAKTGVRSAGTGAKAALNGAGAGAKAGAQAAGTGAKVAWTAINLVMDVVPSRQRRASKARAAPEMAAAAIAGAGAEFLLDPSDGKRRRKMLLDKARSTAMRAGRRGAQKASYAQGLATGAVHEATSGPSVPADDQALADRVRTEIFRRPDAPKGSVNVGVVDGIVYLRGEVPERAEIERLVSGAQSVPGVRAVENLLHLPSTPAPTGGRG